MKYILLTNQYLPTPGATGVCVHAIAKTLAKQGENVYTICYGQANEDKEVIDGVKIVRVNEPAFMTEYTGSSKFKALTMRLSSLGAKLINYNKYPQRSEALIRKYYKALDDLVSNDTEVTIIASYTPLEAVAALGQYKVNHPHIKAIYYSTDTMSNEQGENGFLSVESRRQKGLAWENKLFEVYDGILIMECHKEFYLKSFRDQLTQKMRISNFPLLIKPNEKLTSTDSQTIVYAGTLYKMMRNPSFACTTLLEYLKLGNVYNIVFLGSGDCDDILSDAVSKNCRFSYLGMQPHKIAKDMIDNAAILLSIGNSESQMAPSKIYEYMATGKPIIHFYSYENDPCLEPLRQYGNALIIKENNPNAVEMIKKFLSAPKYLSFESVSGIFEKSTPEYTISLIQEINAE